MSSYGFALRLLDRADHLIQGSESYNSTTAVVVFILPWCYLLALGGLIPALIVGHQWWWIESAFAVVAAIYTTAAVLYWRVEHRVKKSTR